MARIYSHQEYVGIELKNEATWGVDPDLSSGAVRVPFVSEDLHYETDVFPDSEEFSGLGGLLSVDLGRRVVQGSLVVEPAWNAPWFWMLFGLVWGYETKISDREIDDDTTPAAECNTHIWTPGAATKSCAMRVWKAGSSKASGWLDLILGLKVTRFVYEQPPGNRARCTFDFIGKSISTVSTTSLTITTIPAGVSKMKAVDIGNAGIIKVGSAALVDLNIKGFTVEIDRRIEAAENFLNDLFTLDEPDIVGTRATTITIETDLEKDYYGTNKPFYEFIQQNTGVFHVVSQSNDFCEGETSGTLAFELKGRWDFPNITFTDVRPNIRQSGVQPMTITARAAVGAIADATFGYANEHLLPTAGCDVRFLNQIGDDTVLGDSDAKFTTLGDDS